MRKNFFSKDEFTLAEGAVHAAGQHDCRKIAFTLAEVLITLAVIGVVAALTMPTLIQSYKKQVASTRLKKFYSSMEQAIKLSEIDNGPVGYWTKEKSIYDGILNSGSADDDKKNEALAKDREHVKTFYQTYIKPYLRVANEDFEYQDANDNRKILIYLSDGSTFVMHNGNCTDFWFDINGRKSPNTSGRDIFAFLICPSSDTYYWGFSGNQTFKPYAKRRDIMNNDSISREKLLEVCKNSAGFCSGLLMYDNWEFKDDYPYKL